MMKAAPKCFVVPSQQAVHGEQACDPWWGRDEAVDAGTTGQPSQTAVEETDQNQAQPENGYRSADQGHEAHDMIGQTVAPRGGKHPGRDTNQDRKEQGGQG